MAKQRKAVESCWEGFEAFKGAEKVPESSFEAQYRNSLWRFGSAR